MDLNTEAQRHRARNLISKNSVPLWLCVETRDIPMLAIAISHPGGPDVLTPVELPVPKPGAGDVLIRVASAGVNRPDLMQREGKYPPPPGASDIPGLEVAGIVSSCGTGVTRWRDGDHVCALVAGGGYAD